MYTSTANPLQVPQEYALNHYGMRSPEPDFSAPANVYLGCSHTFGEGIDDAELTWPRLVQAHCDDAQYQNLSELGASAGLCYHMLNTSGLKIARVFFLVPHRARWHIVNQTGAFKFNMRLYEQHTQDRRFALALTQEANMLHQYQMAIAAVQAYSQRVPVYIIESDLWPGGISDGQAADHKHPGPDRHAQIAERFISQLRPKSRLR